MNDCDECGLVYASISTDEIPNALLACGPAYRARLEEDSTRLRTRPEPEVWSALECACHVRDVLEVQRSRLSLALVEDCPTFVPMGRDERVERDQYNAEDPARVADQLTQMAELIAADFAALDAGQWERIGIYNWPERSERTMAWLGRHTVHEGVHHLRDIDAALSRVTG